MKRTWTIPSVACLAAAVAGAVVGPAGPSGASTSGATPTIDTYADWEGGAMGCLNRSYTTCGQVITIPEGKDRLREFSLYLHVEGAERAVFRGEVYTWDGVKAGKRVWESDRLKLRANPGQYAEIHLEPQAKVQPGAQYVLFLTFSRDYGALDPDTNGYLAGMPHGALTDGYTAALDDIGNESLWTKRPWSIETPDDWDLAIKVWLRAVH